MARALHPIEAGAHEFTDAETGLMHVPVACRAHADYRRSTRDARQPMVHADTGALLPHPERRGVWPSTPASRAPRPGHQPSCRHCQLEALKTWEHIQAVRADRTRAAVDAAIRETLT